MVERLDRIWQAKRVKTVTCYQRPFDPLGLRVILYTNGATAYKAVSLTEFFNIKTSKRENMVLSIIIH